MRVIAGKYRGRALASPPGDATRPITDRVKETLFNILGSRFGTPGAIPEAAVLDLFAGTGGLGIEALSRGAASCLFVEHNRRCLRVLRENLSFLGPGTVWHVAADNAWTMRYRPSADRGYGLVFVDPPYGEARDPLRVVNLLERVAPSVAPDGLVVFRHHRQTRLPLNLLHSLVCVDEREIGTMRIWLFSPLAERAGAPAVDATPQ